MCIKYVVKLYQPRSILIQKTFLAVLGPPVIMLFIGMKFLAEGYMKTLILLQIADFLVVDVLNPFILGTINYL